MTDLALRVENLGKRYRLGPGSGDRTLREALTESIARSFGTLRPARDRSTQGGSARETFWALRDVSFDVEVGEVLGIVGRNGGGKSTLLKILSRITEPTEGRIEGYGRVGSLLEVGTGFHPELTGSENIYLNGAILGMSKAEITRKYDEIVEFAGVERFLDTPVKRYSSGMYVRLAFAVAAHLEPEILLIDEVLAVGDYQFQKKCLAKMNEVTRDGRTVLFVSHNMLAVQDLCERAIWLDGGRIVAEGPARAVVSRYLETSFATLGDRVWTDPGEAPGTDEVRLRWACVRPVGGVPSAPIRVSDPFLIELEYHNFAPEDRLNLALLLYNKEGVLVFETAPGWSGRPLAVGTYREACRVPANLLNSGMHRIVLQIVRNRGTVIHREDDVLVFDVRDDVDARGGRYAWGGVVRPMLEWSVERIPDGEGNAAGS